MKDSSLFRLGLKDFLRGLLIAVLTPVLVVVQMSLDKGTLIMDWKVIGIAAISAAIAYLTKNFLTPSKDQANGQPGTN